MLFHKLTVSNFRSFAGIHTLDFDRFGCGLHFLTGENRVEPELGANGVGKSSLWDAVHWVLFGTSLQGLRAGHIHSWITPDKNQRKSLENRRYDKNLQNGGGSRVGNKPKHSPVPNCGACWGILDLTLDGQKIKIFRSWKPNRLEITKAEQKPRILTDSELAMILPLDSESFQQSIIIGQFSRMFFNYRPTEKLDLFTNLLSLKFWQERSNIANKSFKDLSAEIVEKNLELVGIRSSIKEVKLSIREIKEDLSALDAKCQEQLVEIEKQFALQTEKKKNLKAKSKMLNKKITRWKTALRKLEKLKAQAVNSIETINREIAHIKPKTLNQEYILRHIDEQCNRLSKISGKCPLCGQKTDARHLQTEFSSLNEKRAEILKIIKSHKKKLHDLEERTKPIEDKICEIIDEITGLQIKIRNEEQEVSKIEYNLQQTNEKEEYLDSLRKNISFEKEALRRKTIAKKKRLARLRKERTILKTAVAELEALSTAVSFWVSGFKDIRLMVVEEALSNLTVEVNNHLGALGMEDWSVSFIVERETKSGGVNRGFQVLVSSPTSQNKAPIPLEVWSGGEGQRLKLASTLGLSNLLLDYHGIKTNLQVWDEPLYGLSGTGRDDMLNLLYEQAHATGKQIWLVDHRALEFGFDSTVYIDKDTYGSHIRIQ